MLQAPCPDLLTKVALLPKATLAVPTCPGAPQEPVEGMSADGDWGKSPVGVVPLVGESCTTRSQRGWLPSHNLSSCWSAVQPGNSWEGPGLQQHFSPLGTLTGCASMLIPSETARTPVYFKKINNVECIDVTQLS